MIAAELLALLRCPETQQPLTAATPALIAELESARVAGALRNTGGGLVESPLSDGLVRADGALFFPVLDGIPLLLVPEAIRLPLSSLA